MSMTERDDKAIWADCAHSIEVIASTELSREDMARKQASNRLSQEWADLAHTSEVLLASALADKDARITRAATARGQRSAAKLGIVKAGALFACALLVVFSFFVREPDRDRHLAIVPAHLAVAAKSLQLVNASPSSSIVRVRMAAPSAGFAKVIELTDPIPPASIQQFWHYH